VQRHPAQQKAAVARAGMLHLASLAAPHLAVRGEQRRVQEVHAAGGAAAARGLVGAVAREELRHHIQ